MIAVNPDASAQKVLGLAIAGMKVLLSGAGRDNIMILHLPLLRVVRQANHVGYWAVVDVVDWWKGTPDSMWNSDQKLPYSSIVFRYHKHEI